MRPFLAAHGFSMLLLSSVLAGGMAGAALGPRAAALTPFGDLFLNLLFTAVVPLVFFSVASAVARAGSTARVGRLLAATLAVFIATSLLAAAVALVAAVAFRPAEGVDFAPLRAAVGDAQPAAAPEGFARTAVAALTVADFPGLLSRRNILALVVFSLLVGLAAARAGERAAPLPALLEAGAATSAGVIDLVMWYAPVGLACFFAALVGDLGAQLLSGYLRVFLLYLALTALYAVALLPLLAFLAAGRDGVARFLAHAVPPSLTALATCSSAATIPANLAAARRIGVPDDVARTVLPLGAAAHKDGSVVGGTLKIVFLFALFGYEVAGASTLLGILAVSFLVGAVMGAIPGGGMIGELLILSLYGFPPESLPLIAVISTVIDAPATFLNSTGNLACSMLVARLADGRGWLARAA